MWGSHDPIAEASDAAMEALIERWEKWCDETGVPFEAADEDHPHHDIYMAWEALQDAIMRRDEALTELGLKSEDEG